MCNRKQSIFAAALECVFEHDLDSCAPQMICERSRASIGSLSHHFGDKQRLLAACAWAVWRTMQGWRRVAERLMRAT